MEKMKGRWKRGLLGASELEGMVGCQKCVPCRSNIVTPQTLNPYPTPKAFVGPVSHPSHEPNPEEYYRGFNNCQRYGSRLLV